MRQFCLFLKGTVDDTLVEPFGMLWGARPHIIRWRMCIGNRALNKQIVKDLFLLPCIDALLECLDQAKVFSKLDLALGYHQIEMK